MVCSPSAPPRTFMPINARKPDFGAWLKRRLDDAGVNLTELSSSSKIAYPNLNTLVNSGKHGEPTQPKVATMHKIVSGLRQLGLLHSEDEGDVWVAAGYEVDEYVVVRKSEIAETEYESDPNFQIIAEAYRGASETGKRHIKSAAELAAELSRENSIGKRAD